MNDIRNTKHKGKTNTVKSPKKYMSSTTKTHSPSLEKKLTNFNNNYESIKIYKYIYFTSFIKRNKTKLE
jgi:hypothetical protein